MMVMQMIFDNLWFVEIYSVGPFEVLMRLHTIFRYAIGFAVCQI